MKNGITTVYKARDGWRWRAVHRNGNVVAESGEAYTRRGRCAEMADEYGPVQFVVEIQKPKRKK